MAEFIRKRQKVHIEEYRLVYVTDIKRGTSFSFPCDKEGRVLTLQLSDVALLNFQHCCEGDISPRVEDYSYDHWDNAAIKCVRCDEEVVLHGFTNTCLTCKTRGITTDYNLSGQLLAPRSQWGEETGETYADIVRGGEDY